MLDAGRILEIGAAIARKHDMARHRYQSVRYGKLSSVEETLAEDLVLYGLMRLAEFDRTRFPGADVALTPYGPSSSTRRVGSTTMCATGSARTR